MKKKYLVLFTNELEDFESDRSYSVPAFNVVVEGKDRRSARRRAINALTKHLIEEGGDDKEDAKLYASRFYKASGYDCEYNEIIVL